MRDADFCHVLAVTRLTLAALVPPICRYGRALFASRGESVYAVLRCTGNRTCPWNASWVSPVALVGQTNSSWEVTQVRAGLSGV